jgi:hypothetical protein
MRLWEETMPAATASNRGPRAIPISLSQGKSLKVYAGLRVKKALEEVTANMTLWELSRFAIIVDAVYAQGRTDGRSDVFNELERLKHKPELAHRNPGRPNKKGATVKKAAKRAVAKRKAPAKKAAKGPATKTELAKSTAKRAVAKKPR